MEGRIKLKYLNLCIYIYIYIFYIFISLKIEGYFLALYSHSAYVRLLSSPSVCNVFSPAIEALYVYSLISQANTKLINTFHANGDVSPILVAFAKCLDPDQD